MNMKKIFAVILCALILAGVLASCGSSDKAANESFGYAADYGEAEEAVGEGQNYQVSDMAPGAAEKGKMAGEVTDEKLVKTVEISMETKEYKECIASLQAAASANGGYVETSDIESNGYNERSNRYARIVFRIPADKLDAFLAGTDEKGRTVSKTENVVNVTMEYVDTESRIKACEAERDSLLAILEKAQTVEDIISVRTRLTEVNYEIETYTAQLRVLQNRVGYSTVTVSIREVERVTEEETSLGSEIKNRFLESWDSLVEFLRSALVGFVGGLPIILPLAAIAAVIIILLKRRMKKRKNRKESKKTEAKSENE